MRYKIQICNTYAHFTDICSHRGILSIFQRGPCETEFFITPSTSRDLTFIFHFSSQPQPLIVDPSRVALVRTRLQDPAEPTTSSSVPGVQRVQFIQSSSRPDGSIVFNAPPPPPALIIQPPNDRDSDEENINYDQSTESEHEDDEADSMRAAASRGELSPQTSRMLKEGYRRIEAKEPNFTAQPDRPVLRRPGQPSRLRLNGKCRSSKEECGSSPLPSKLTDDSDSDAPIQYRDDPITAAAAAARRAANVAQPTSSSNTDEEDEEDVPKEKSMFSQHLSISNSCFSRWTRCKSCEKRHDGFETRRASVQRRHKRTDGWRPKEAHENSVDEIGAVSWSELSREKGSVFTENWANGRQLKNSKTGIYYVVVDWPLLKRWRKKESCFSERYC